MSDYLHKLNELRVLLKDDTVSLFYRGIMDDDFTDKFISIVAFDSERRVKGRMAFVMAESFQNVVRHRDKDLEEINNSAFGIRGRDEWMHIFSSNLVKKQVKELLEKKISDINELDKDGLKQAYLEILESGELSEKGGAGMGLIEMARRSKNPLQFEFRPYEEDVFAFNMQVDFQRKKDEVTQENLCISKSSELSDIILHQEVLFAYRGEFSDEVLQPMIPIVESNTAGAGTIGYSIFHVAVELMQNIGRHGKQNRAEKRMGIFVLRRLNDGYYLCSGNYVDEGVDEVMDHVAFINDKDEDELNERYKKALKQSVLNDQNSAGVGMIDMRRTAKNPIEIEHVQDELGTYLMIGVKIDVA